MRPNVGAYSAFSVDLELCHLQKGGTQSSETPSFCAEVENKTQLNLNLLQPFKHQDINTSQKSALIQTLGMKEIPGGGGGSFSLPLTQLF